MIAFHALGTLEYVAGSIRFLFRFTATRALNLGE